MPIKNLSERRQLPRLGKIRLGVKNQAGIPQKSDHFVVPPEVGMVYGDTPKELDILLPLDELHEVFPQFYKEYGTSTGLKVICDGEIMRVRAEGGGWKGYKCNHVPEQHDKMIRATLNVILPKVNWAGVYQVVTGSVNSIIKLNSSFEFIKRVYGTIAMLPLKLILEEQDINYQGKRGKAYTMRLSFSPAEIDAYFAERGQKIQPLMGGPVALPEPAEETIDVEDEEADLDKIFPEDEPAEDAAPLPTEEPSAEIPATEPQTPRPITPARHEPAYDLSPFGTVVKKIEEAKSKEDLDKIHDAMDALYKDVFSKGQQAALLGLMKEQENKIFGKPKDE